jgi:hypothetical protein
MSKSHYKEMYWREHLGKSSSVVSIGLSLNSSSFTVAGRTERRELPLLVNHRSYGTSSFKWRNRDFEPGFRQLST